MPYFHLHVDLEFDNLSRLTFDPATVDPTLSCNVRCSSCHENQSGLLVRQSEERESADGKSTSNYRGKCKYCKNDIVITICKLTKDLISTLPKHLQKLQPINEYYFPLGVTSYEEDDCWNDKTSKTAPTNTLFAVIEIRNAELLSFEITQSTFLATNDGKTMYDMGDLTTDGSYEVDNNNQEISVTLKKYRLA